MASNKPLAFSKRNKQDEFYTQLSDIEAEMVHYKDIFKGKTVYLNCDNAFHSNFFLYFSRNIKTFGIKKLFVNCLRSDGSGDFRSDESIEMLKQADIVVTNPPFSLFRDYMAQLFEYKKQFLILGSMNAITYKSVYPLIKDDKLWLGVNNGSKEFQVPDSYEAPNSKNIFERNGKKFVKMGNVLWLTNLDHDKRHQILELDDICPCDYLSYDNYDAINVDRVKDIPRSYMGYMGVPVSFLTKHNPDQFELIQFRKGDDGKDLRIRGKDKYHRIIIKRKINECR